MNDLINACNFFINLVKDVEELFISFDHSRDLVEILWGDLVFQVPVYEVEQTLNAIKFLNEREQMVQYKRNYDENQTSLF